MGIPTLISTATADDDSALNITSGIDSTYDEYMLVGINLDHDTDMATVLFQGSIDGGSNYNVAMTTAAFYDYHYEDGSSNELAYWPAADLAQGTGYLRLVAAQNTAAADKSACFIMNLFSPSNTTYVKHFYAYGLVKSQTPGVYNHRSAGYFNTTSAINALSFKPSSGNIVAGIIQLYGIS